MGENGTFQVVFKGLAQGVDPQSAIQKLSATFGTTPENFSKLVTQAPVVIKSGIDRETAEKFKQALTQSGGIVEIVSPEATPTPPAESSAESTVGKKCPKCGYVRGSDEFAPDYECPKCGIVYAKYEKMMREGGHPSQPPGRTSSKQPSSYPPSPSSLAPPPRGGLTISGRTIGIIVGCVVLLALVFVIYAFVGGSDDEEIAEETEDPYEEETERIRAAHEAIEALERSKIRIFPGETANLKLTSYLPLLHARKVSTRPSVSYKVRENSWEDRGVRVRVNSARLRVESAKLWEGKREDGDWFLPSIASENLHSNRIPSVNFLLTSQSVSTYVNLGQQSKEGFLKIARSINIKKARQTRYTVYKVILPVNIRIPDNEEIKNLKGYHGKTGTIGIATTGILFNAPGFSGALSLNHYASITLEQTKGKAGIVVKSSWKVEER